MSFLRRATPIGSARLDCDRGDSFFCSASGRHNEEGFPLRYVCNLSKGIPSASVICFSIVLANAFHALRKSALSIVETSSDVSAIQSLC